MSFFIIFHPCVSCTFLIFNLTLPSCIPLLPLSFHFQIARAFYCRQHEKRKGKNLNNKKQRIRQASLLMLLNCIPAGGKRNELI